MEEPLNQNCGSGLEMSDRDTHSQRGLIKRDTRYKEGNHAHTLSKKCSLGLEEEKRPFIFFPAYLDDAVRDYDDLFVSLRRPFWPFCV